MLGGLDIQVVKFSELIFEHNKLRLDAEFFKKENIQLLSQIKKWKYKRISEIASVTDGIHSSIDFCENSEINLISAKSPKDNYFDLSGNAYISTKQHKENPKTALRLNDVIISTVGTIGNTAVVQQEQLPANSDRHVGIIRIKENIPAYYLSTFLNSKYGRFQSLRESTGNVQLSLFVYKINEMLIPVFDDEFHESIQGQCELAHQKLRQSKIVYEQAQNLLLEHLGLKDFNPPLQKVNIKSFSNSFGTSGRLDAEFYQEKYEKLIDKIKSYPKGYNTLDYFIKDFSTGFAYKSETYTETGIPLIRINNIGNGTLDISNAMLIPQGDISLSPKDVANENDILISMSGTIGNSCKVPKGVNAVVNQRIMRISPQNINVEVLPLIINSIIGKYQLERMGTGGVQTNISANDIKQIVIPNVEEKIQTQIADLIRQSNYLRIKSKGLLEKAKKAVELAIEKDQESALDFIKGKQTNDCNVH